LLDADADRADLELWLIKLSLKNRARVHPFADNGGLWRKAAVRSGASVTTSDTAWRAASTDSSARCRDCLGVLSRAIDQNDFAGAAADRSPISPIQWAVKRLYRHPRQ
jgi:hypothetical protein